MDIELICEICGKKFSRKKGEVNRNKKLGRRTYCSLECVGKDNNEHLDKYKGRIYPNLCRTTDEFSSFRFHLKTIHYHCKQRKKYSSNITIQDLKEQWDKQKGKCPYTGWALKTPIDTNHKNQLPKTPDRASVDRIDNSKPYTKDNIQFVSMMAQYAKNSWHEEELLKFCKAVVENQNRLV